MSPEELEAIRMRVETHSPHQVGADRAALLAEVDDLLKMVGRLPGGDQELERTGRK